MSFIIPAFNEEKYIGACLENILRHAPHAVGEIIVVDNASTDRTASVASSFPGVRVIREERKGPSFARQRGFEEAQFPLLAYLDADCRITSDWIRVAALEWEKDPNIVCLSGPHMYSRDDLPSVLQRALSFVFWRVVTPVACAVTGYVIAGGNFIVKYDALRKIGGFDLSIPFYGDDTNLGRRLHDIGRVRFAVQFRSFTSGRRLQHSFIGSAIRYVLNYLSEAIFHRPVTKRYEDFR